MSNNKSEVIEYRGYSAARSWKVNSFSESGDRINIGFYERDKHGFPSILVEKKSMTIADLKKIEAIFKTKKEI